MVIDYFLVFLIFLLFSFFDYYSNTRLYCWIFLHLHHIEKRSLNIGHSVQRGGTCLGAPALESHLNFTNDDGCILCGIKFSIPVITNFCDCRDFAYEMAIVDAGHINCEKLGLWESCTVATKGRSSRWFKIICVCMCLASDFLCLFHGSVVLSRPSWKAKGGLNCTTQLFSLLSYEVNEHGHWVAEHFLQFFWTGLPRLSTSNNMGSATFGMHKRHWNWWFSWLCIRWRVWN